MLRQSTAASFALILGVSVATGCKPEAEEPVTNRVRILATTDEHSHVLAVSPEIDEWPLPSPTTVGDGSLKGGVARRATVLERERADGIPTVVLSNGDFSQGTLSAVAYTVANFDVMLMRQLGYDAIALANHEFDLGPAMAAQAVAAAYATGGAPPFVLTNALTTTGTAFDESGTLYGGVGSGRPIVKGLVIDKGGIKVGVVSALGPSAAYDVQYQATPVTFSTADLGASYPTYIGAATISIASILQPVITDLRTNQGAQVVVLLFHGGLASTGANGDVDYLVPLLSGVDLVVSGHTHGLPPNGTELLADADSRQVPVMQAAPYGNQVLRAEFVVGGARPTFDAARQAFLDVDDTLPPTANQEIRAGISTTLSSIEGSLLGPTLQAVTGRVIGDNPSVVGDLYFFPVGHTAFDVTGATLPAETNALNLDTDAMLTVANAVGYTARVALQNAGSIRGDLVQGKTGTLGFSDVFRMVSLGGDPIEGTPGFPLMRVYISLAELRAAFEQTLQMAYANNDYYVGSSGPVIAWDPSRDRCLDGVACAAGPGWITHLGIEDGGVETPYYDLTLNPVSGWLVDPTTVLVPIVAPYLVAAFADTMGITLRDAVGTPLDIVNSAADFDTAVVKWPTGAHVKDHQALGAFIYSDLFGLGGELPAALYDLTMPVRSVCSRAGATNPEFPCPYP